jgi:hypothetical protein
MARPAVGYVHVRVYGVDRWCDAPAAALDPLTGALLTLPQIRETVDRLFEAERPWLGELAA